MRWNWILVFFLKIPYQVETESCGEAGTDPYPVLLYLVMKRAIQTMFVQSEDLLKESFQWFSGHQMTGPKKKHDRLIWFWHDLFLVVFDDLRPHTKNPQTCYDKLVQGAVLAKFSWPPKQAHPGVRYGLAAITRGGARPSVARDRRKSIPTSNTIGWSHAG